MFVDDLFNKKTLTENNGGGSPWHSEPEQQQMDANRRGGLERERNAGLDEPDDVPSGAAPTGNGVYEYTVPAGQEDIAQELGLQQHRGHWVSRVPIQRANFQFGRPQFHEIPSQGVAEGLGKTIKRGMAGWGAFDKDKPADVVKRVKGQDTDTLKGLSNRGSTGKGSPAELQQKAISRELKKRGEQGVAEGMLDNPGAQDSPVASAIVRRILLQRTDLLSKYGPEKVGAAVDEVADFVGNVDEIGSSDVSGWVRHVEQMLGNMDQGVDEDMSRRGFLRGLGAAALGAAGVGAASQAQGKVRFDADGNEIRANWKNVQGAAPAQGPAATTGANTTAGSAASSPSAASRAAANDAADAAAKIRYTNPKFRQEYEPIENAYNQNKSRILSNTRYSPNPDLAKRQQAEFVKMLIALDLEFAEKTNALIKQYSRLKEQDVAEGTEQIDELSPATLTSYKNKARAQVQASPGATNYNAPTTPKIANRARGAVKADNRLHGFGPVKKSTQGVAEGQLDELSFKDIQRSANKFAKGANKFTKNVADTGAAVGNAAGALGGAIKQVGKTAIADPLAATYNATKSGLGKASNVAANTYGDVKKGVQAVGKAGQAVGSDIGAAGTAVGKGIQSVGRGVANVAGGTTGALGSVVGGATTGLGRAAASGFNAGVQNVGGDAVDNMQTNIMTPKAADIQKKIATKQDEIKALQAALAGEQSAAPTGGKSGIQTGATALIDPDTERPYEKDKLAAMYGYKEPEAAAANTPAAPAAQPQGFSAANVMNLPGMAKTPAKPAAPAKTANFAGPGGYGKTTTGIKAPAAPSSPALAAPKLPSAPRVTAGGPTPAEKANLDKRIAAVAEALTQVERMLESVNSKKSAEMVKAYVDQRFTELGLRNTTECRNIMARVVQESAIRRRQHAKSLAK